MNQYGTNPPAHARYAYMQQMRRESYARARRADAARVARFEARAELLRAR